MNVHEQKTEWIADALRRHAYLKGISMRTVATEIGVTPQYLSAILNNRKNASDKIVNKIEEITGEKFNIVKQVETVNEPQASFNTPIASQFIEELKQDKIYLQRTIEDLRTILKNITK